MCTRTCVQVGVPYRVHTVPVGTVFLLVVPVTNNMYLWFAVAGNSTDSQEIQVQQRSGICDVAILSKSVTPKNRRLVISSNVPGYRCVHL